MNDDIVNRLRDQRDEDGYCVVCGDGKWKSHFPKCVMCDAADEIDRLRALITAWADAEDAAWGTESGRLEEACDALRKAVGR